MATLKLTDQESAKAKAFRDERESASPTLPTAIGGRWSYIVTPTSIGTAVTIRDAHGGAELDLTEYESW